MKSTIKAMIISSGLITTMNAHAFTCTINGSPIVFSKDENPGIIVTKKFVIDQDAYLSFHANPFYGIGSSVDLRISGNSVVLLKWLNDFSEDINYSKVLYKDNEIECSL